MDTKPDISTIPWLDASGVLGHEERGFSVWLADNLSLLAEALEVPELSFVDREVRVEQYRADILALADDGTDEGLPVIIENQYGTSNHDHLGKVVTYLAGQQRGLGVWVVERFTDAHLAAVEFLNRTSDETVGYALVRVRFAPAASGYYVDFQVGARPNQWLKAVRAAGESSKTAAPERRALLEAVHDLAGDRLRAQGWKVRLGSSRRFIELLLPDGHPLAPHGYMSLRTSATTFRFRHVITGLGSFEESAAVVAALRDRYAGTLEAALPAGTMTVWGTEGARKNAVNDQWYADHPGGGWRDLAPEDAAEWSVQVCGGWIQALTSDVPHDVIGEVDAPGY